MANNPPAQDAGVSLIVPFRSDRADRDRAWAFLRARYERLYPDWEIVERNCDGPWSKGRAVNSAVRASSGDILVIADADVLVNEDVPPTAIRWLERVPWVVPHGNVNRLNKPSTAKLIANGNIVDEELSEPIKRATPGGGIVVLPKTTYERVGIDERFELWGGEDMAFGWALQALAGEPACLNYPMWHLYHPRAYVRSGQKGSLETEALLSRYQAASGDPEAIKRVMEKT